LDFFLSDRENDKIFYANVSTSEDSSGAFTLLDFKKENAQVHLHVLDTDYTSYIIYHKCVFKNGVQSGNSLITWIKLQAKIKSNN
jgi:hypothetical protein